MPETRTLSVRSWRTVRLAVYQETQKQAPKSDRDVAPNDREGSYLAAPLDPVFDCRLAISLLDGKNSRVA
jgi:hypothetical protein